MNERLRCQRKPWDSKLREGGPGCVHVILHEDTPVNLEVIPVLKRWKPRRLRLSHLPEVTEQNPGVCDYNIHVLIHIMPPQFLSAHVTISYEDPFNMRGS